MNIQDVLYYGLWAGLFFLFMRFGCGHHIMGHGYRRHEAKPANSETPTGRPVDPSQPWATGKEHH
jgi:hypothetical protein